MKIARHEAFTNLKEKFSQWLLARDIVAANGHYCENLEAIGCPIAPHLKPGAAWFGLYELLTGEKPEVGIYHVSSIADFSKNYGKAVSFFGLSKKDKKTARALYPNCRDFDALFDFAYTHESGDGGHTRNAFNRYSQFLCELENGVLESPWPVVKNKVLPGNQRNDFHGDILSAIRTKPFILLAGISGTGKSRLVRQLARGCCPEGHPLRDEQKPGNYELIPVRPNWHDSTELMGYVTRITGTGTPKYVLTPFVKFLVKAWLHKDVPFFLCLDEMNLAPVEQYFAEYLSVIETRKLSGGDIVTDVLVEFPDEVRTNAIDELLAAYKPVVSSATKDEVTTLENMMKADKGIRLPPNLVVMGTVNMDETTCSFSRKVLDRAMSFELNDVEDMYTISANVDPDIPWGAFNDGSVNRAKQTYVTAEDLYAEADAAKKATNMETGEKVLAYLKAVNAVLDKTPFKVAYRTRNEMMLYCVERGGDLANALDEVTSMKILSRIEGDENALRVTDKLVESAAVVSDPHSNDAPKNLIQLLKFVILKQLGVVDGTLTNATAIPSTQDYETLEGKFRICSAKLDEMNDRLLSGYTGFWR